MHRRRKCVALRQGLECEGNAIQPRECEESDCDGMGEGEVEG